MSERIRLVDVAKEAGVTAATVSMALNNNPQIADATKVRIRKLAAEMGYRVDPVARALRQGNLGQDGRFLGTLALLESEAFMQVRKTEPNPVCEGWHVQLKEICEGMGYKLDHFTVGVTEKEQKALSRVLKARGIQGLVVIGFNQIISKWALDWDAFAAVTYSGSLHEHFIHNVLSHSYQDTHDAVIRLHEMGYVRPGYVTEQYHVDAWRAGYNAALNTLGFEDKVPVLRMQNRLGTSGGRKEFLKWFRQFDPDVLISSYQDEFPNLLREEGVRIPGDIGYFSLDVWPSVAHLSGLKQFREGALQTAVDLLHSILLRHQFGPPARPMCIQVPSEWNKDGTTLKMPV